MSVPYRIEMHIIHMPLEIELVAYLVLVEAALPDHGVPMFAA